MIPIARRIIWKEKLRFLITICGVGLSIMLILFFFELFEGIKTGAVSYIRSTTGEFWISNRNATNLMRTSSFLQATTGTELARLEGVETASPLLQVIATTTIGAKSVTLLILGVDLDSPLTAPTDIILGALPAAENEIIVDRAFAAKHRLNLNDSLIFENKAFRVCGVCDGTNLLVSQFAFVSLPAAQQLMGLPGAISFYVVRLKPGRDADDFSAVLQARFAHLSIYDKQTFVDNNLEELRSGVLPVLGTVAVVGTIIGTAVITLMLFSSVMDKREEYALLKAIGASQSFISLLVLKQSLLSSICGFFVGLLLYQGSAPLIMKIVPELTLHANWQVTATIGLLSLFIGTIGALAPLWKLSAIYPGEVFRP